MKRYRTLLIITMILLFVGIPVLLSAAERLKITPPGAFNLQERELKAPLAIKNDLQALRAKIAAEKLNFEIGYTAAMDFDLALLAGLKVPADINAKIKAQNSLALIRLRALPAVAAVCSAAAPSFDWRKGGSSTPVKDQGGCGSCWDFATCGAFEGSYRKINNVTLNVSEQDILDCNSHGYSCAGGWWAFDDLIDKGKKSVADEATYPYTHVKGACKNVARPYKAVAWGYVGNDHSIPSVTDLKKALCDRGPIAVALKVTPLWRAYTGGVFNEPNAGSGVNHGVTLYGWDDSKGAWLIKNSWGTGWGSTCEYGSERGFMWMKYGTNNVGYAAAWTRAETKQKPLAEDCVGFNPATAAVKKIDNRWKIVDGSHWMFDFGKNEAAAKKSLAVIKFYKMNKSCFVGRPDASFKYLLVGNNAPVGNMGGQDCIKFNPAAIEVKKIGANWKIVQGNMWMYDFGNKQDEAEFSMKMIKKYGFTNQCFVARPNPPFEYLHK
jgi:cathepsin L